MLNLINFDDDDRVPFGCGHPRFAVAFELKWIIDNLDKGVHVVVVANDAHYRALVTKVEYFRSSAGVRLTSISVVHLPTTPADVPTEYLNRVEPTPLFGLISDLYVVGNRLGFCSRYQIPIKGTLRYIAAITEVNYYHEIVASRETYGITPRYHVTQEVFND